MVLSLFPKRRRRRRWHGVPDHGSMDPPSFSDIQPEPTICSEKEVSAIGPVPKTPLSRSRRKSTVGTPCVEHELSAKQLQRESSELSFEQPGSAKERTSEQPHGDTLEYVGRSSFRRSSRLLQNCSMNPVMPLSPISVVESRKTPRRVSFSVVETKSSAQHRENLSLTGRLSALSAGEENSDYHAFIHGMIDVDLMKISTTCSRASMTDPNSFSEEESAERDGAESSDMTNSDRNRGKSPRDKLERRKQPAPSESPERIVTQPTEVTIRTTEMQNIKRTEKVKPEMKDARCSTTGLDQFVRSSRRKKSICVQIDLDKTAAFGTTSLRDVAGEDVRPDCSDRIMESEPQEPWVQLPTQSSSDAPIVGDDAFCTGLRHECNHEDSMSSLSYGERRPNELTKDVQSKSRTKNPNDESSLGIAVRSRAKRKTRQDDMTPEEERTKEISILQAELRIAEVNQDHRSAMLNVGVPADDFQTQSESAEAVKSNGCSEVPNGDVGPTSGKRTRDSLYDHSNSKLLSSKRVSEDLPSGSTKPHEIASRSDVAQHSGKGSASMSLRSSHCDPSSSSSFKKPLPPIPERTSDCSTRAKPSRTTRVRVVAKRRSPEIDILGVAQRIKKRIERKKLIENTIYRRVNLIYEGLWEDFLETYYPEKWRKLKDVWMVRKAQKRLEEEQRGLGELDQEMEREVELGTQLGAAKYMKDFEEMRARENGRKFVNGQPSGKTVGSELSPLEDDSRRRSRRLRDLAPLQSYC